MLNSVTTLPKHFSINIISLEGNVGDITVEPHFSIERVKTIALKHFYGDDAFFMPSEVHLIHSSKFKQLADVSDINDEEISEHDTLLLVQARRMKKIGFMDFIIQSPNEETILQVTNNLPVCNPPRPIPFIDCAADLLNDIQKILVTLVKASAKILMHGSETQKYYDILKEKLKARCKPTIDPNTVDTLMDMGYSRMKVLKALHLRKSNITEALGWLIDHQNDPDDDDNDDDLDLFIIEEDNDKYVADSSSSTTARKKSLKDTCIELFKGENQGLKKDGNLISIVDLLLESFHRYKKIDFKPNFRAVQSLLGMGFEKTSVIGALKITGNHLTNACQWLLGERRRSLQDLGEGLDPDGSIYKAIMNCPHIQLSLTNPKIFLTYLSMLETPSADIWINDPEVLPVINPIIKIYHVEKHAIHMNRYAAN